MDEIFGDTKLDKNTTRIKAKVSSLIFDFQNCLGMLKQMNKVLEYEAAPPPTAGGITEGSNVPLFH